MGRKGKRGIKRGRGRVKGGEGTKEEERDDKERGVDMTSRHEERRNSWEREG